MTRNRFLTALGSSLCIFLSVCHPGERLEDGFGLESGRKESASIWYSRGNSIVYLSLIGHSMAALSRQPEVGIPISMVSLIGQYAGLAIVGNSAVTYCEESEGDACRGLGWPSFWTSLASLGTFSFVAASMAIDENRNRDIGAWKPALAFAAGPLILVGYFYSWYSFYKVKSSVDGEESRLSLDPVLDWSGGNPALGLKLSSRF